MPHQNLRLRRLLCVVLLCAAALAIPVQTPAQSEEDEERIEDLYTAGRFDDAIRLAQKVVADTERALGPKHLDVAEALQTLGRLYVVTNRHAGAEQAFRRALAILEGDPDADSGDVALTLSGLAVAYYQIGRYAEAEPMLKRALSLLELEPADEVDATDIAELLHSLSTFYHDTGRYAEAEPLLKRAISIYEAESGTTLVKSH